jgi:hypothetical protein
LAETTSDVPAIQVAHAPRVQFMQIIENRPFLRIFLRGQLRRSDLPEDTKKAIRKALNDGDVLDAVCAELAARPGVAREGMPFLDWLLENADEILALIIKIIGLF